MLKMSPLCYSGFDKCSYLQEKDIPHYQTPHAPVYYLNQGCSDVETFMIITLLYIHSWRQVTQSFEKYGNSVSIRWIIFTAWILISLKIILSRKWTSAYSTMFVIRTDNKKFSINFYSIERGKLTKLSAFVENVDLMSHIFMYLASKPESFCSCDNWNCRRWLRRLFFLLKWSNQPSKCLQERV